MREPPIEQRNLGFLEQFQIPAVRTYIFTGLAALLVFYTLMPGDSSNDIKLGALLTIIIAIPGLTSRWIISPILFLILVTYLLFDTDFSNLARSIDGKSALSSGPAFQGGDRYFKQALLAVCIVFYMIAHYRVMSFVHKSMPDDPAPRRKGQPEPDIPRRPFRLLGDSELTIGLVLAAVSAAVGLGLWEIIDKWESSSRLGGTWGLSRSFARFIVFMWSVGTGAVLVGVVFRYLALRRMSWLEARLIVQDLFWLETRREQERIYRWRAWASKSNAVNQAKGDS